MVLGSFSTIFVCDESFIADMGNNRIRKIGVDKKISTIAGDGTYGDFKEGEEATKSPLARLFSLAFNDAGELFFINRNIADTENYRVRMVNSEEIISTIAGTGPGVHYGDGGPAKEATHLVVQW